MNGVAPTVVESGNQAATDSVPSVYAPLGLRDDPFPRDPLAGAWVQLPSRQSALRAIASLLDQDHPGLAVVGGGTGSGKTRLLHRLSQASADPDRAIGIVADPGGRWSDAHLLRAIVVALGGEAVGRTGLELATEARTLLEARRDDRRIPAIMIDNAALAGSHLEILRSLLAPPQGETRVQIVLFGPPELEDRIVRRRSLARYLRESVTLMPLSPDETRLLIEERIAAMRIVGRDSIFTPTAMEVLARIAGGNIGATLTLAHRCLREAIASGVRQVDAGVVEQMAESPERDRAGDDDRPIQTRLILPGLRDAPPSRRGGRRR